MGRLKNGVMEKDPCWDLNPGMAAMLGLNHAVLGVEGGSLEHAA